MNPANTMALAALGVALLGGCATNQSAAATPKREPDCSFRSATTCWTMASRFPPPRPAARDSAQDKLLEEPPARLASGE
jgi:hypothetical protein